MESLTTSACCSFTYRVQKPVLGNADLQVINIGCGPVYLQAAGLKAVTTECIRGRGVVEVARGRVKKGGTVGERL